MICFIGDLKIVTFRAIAFNLKLNYELLACLIFRKVLIYIWIFFAGVRLCVMC
jgi:hypothetical protein